MNDKSDKDQRDAKTTESGVEQIDAAQAEIAELKDRYLRLRAEMDNFRKQQIRRSADQARQEKKLLLLRVVEVIDDLSRALTYQDVADRESLLNALKLTFSQLGMILDREGVTPLESQGKPFDPNVHEAVESISSPTVPKDHVAQEVQRGYRYGDELLRPARVNVSNGETATQR